MDTSTELILNEVKDLAGIDPRMLIDEGLLTQEQARKWLVKQRYFQMAKTGRKYKDIKYELSVSYGLSVSKIEKLVYRK